MNKLLTSRLLQAIFVMIAVTAMAFLMFRFVGDPVAAMVREGASQEEKDTLRRSLGLDKSMVVQFFAFVGVEGIQKVVDLFLFLSQFSVLFVLLT